jgi:hypothetical protein
MLDLLRCMFFFEELKQYYRLAPEDLVQTGGRLVLLPRNSYLLLTCPDPALLDQFLQPDAITREEFLKQTAQLCLMILCGKLIPLETAQEAVDQYLESLDFRLEEEYLVKEVLSSLWRGSLSDYLASELKEVLTFTSHSDRPPAAFVQEAGLSRSFEEFSTADVQQTTECGVSDISEFIIYNNPLIPDQGEVWSCKHTPDQVTNPWAETEDQVQTDMMRGSFKKKPQALDLNNEALSDNRTKQNNMQYKKIESSSEQINTRNDTSKVVSPSLNPFEDDMGNFSELIQPQNPLGPRWNGNMNLDRNQHLENAIPNKAEVESKQNIPLHLLEHSPVSVSA